MSEEKNVPDKNEEEWTEEVNFNKYSQHRWTKRIRQPRFCLQDPNFTRAVHIVRAAKENSVPLLKKELGFDTEKAERFVRTMRSLNIIRPSGEEKEKSMTKDEINRRLDILRSTRENGKSFSILRPKFAMCYSTPPPGTEEEEDVSVVSCKCPVCGETFEVTDNMYTAYENLVADFLSLGMDAKLIYRCPECENDENQRCEIHVKAPEETEWHVSFPVEAELADLKQRVSFAEYRLVLDFLAFPDRKSRPGSKQKELSYNELSFAFDFSRDYAVESVFVKTQADLALKKVLGTNIVYDINEVRQNLRALFDMHLEFMLAGVQAYRERISNTYTIEEYLNFALRIQKNMWIFPEWTDRREDSE